jgi:superfamily II DNA or RNA helicase
MELVHIEKIDEVYIRVNTDPSTKMELSDFFTFDVPGAKFMPAYKNKMWDGKIRLFNAMTGIVYAGLLNYIYTFCKNRDYEVVIDKNVSNVNEKIPEDIADIISKSIKSKYEPRDYQKNAVYHALKNDRSLLLSPTASGKSFIIYLITRYHLSADRKILIVVPTTSLVEQMESDFLDYNNGKEMSIHKIRGGIDKNIDADITITTWQSVYKQRKDWFQKFDVVFGDEAHLFKAKSLTSILEKMDSTKYRYGFTGTLDGSQTHKLVLEGLFGPVFEVTKTSKLIEEKTLADFNIKAIVLEYSDEDRKSCRGKTYPEEIDWIVKNERRNKFIRNLAWELKGNTLILFQYVDKHGKILQPMLEKDGKQVHFIHGGVDVDTREDVRKIAESSSDNIILASYGTFSTGVNIKRLDNIIFASPSKSKVRNLQSIGRVLRKGNGKNEATLYDIVDDLQWKSNKNFAAQHFIERMKIYSDEGFEVKIYNVPIKK